MAIVDSSLTAIRKKVRLLTRSPSENLISTADIDSYINTFVLYDFPESVRLFSLRKTFTFYTIPNISTYKTNTVNVNDPLYDFNNAIISTHDPIHIAGYRSYFTQSRDEFLSKWPIRSFIRSVGSGTGAKTNFTGTLTDIPVLPDELIFTSIGPTGEPLTLKAVNVVDGAGLPTRNGNLYDVYGIIPNAPNAVLLNNKINFVTGVFDITFPSAPANGQAVNAQTVPYVAARPLSVLYFDNTFTVRPVPDQPYPITIEAYTRPTELLAGQKPELEQWWQFIAFSSAKKILEDRNDYETIAAMMPSLKEQEKLVLRRTLVQQGDERAATIYSQQTSLSGSTIWGWNNYY